MAALQCEICGGKLVAKAGGIFECEFCGMQYDKTRIQEMVREMQAGAKTENAPAIPVQAEPAVTVQNLIERGFMAIESRHFDDARQAFGKALEMDPRCGDAHLGIAIASTEYADRNAFWADLFAHKFPEHPSMARARECSLIEPYRSEMELYKKHLAEETEKENAAVAHGTESRALYAELRKKYARARNMLGNRRWIHADRGGIAGSAPIGADERWGDIVAVNCNYSTAAGICPDGSVIISWGDGTTDIIAPAPKAVKVIAVGAATSMDIPEVLILREDGSAISVEPGGKENYRSQHLMKGWENLADITLTATSPLNMIGVRRDGTVIGFYEHDIESLSKLANVVEAAGGKSGWINWKAFLTVDGRVVLDEKTKEKLHENGDMSIADRIEKWTDVIQITGVDSVLVGLKADGTVAAENMDCKGLERRTADARAQALSTLQGAVAVFEGTVLLKDGYVWEYESGFENVLKPVEMGYSSNKTVIRLFNDFETLEEECRIGAQRRAAVRYRRDMLKTEQENLTRERAGLGLFAGKRRKEIDERLVQIDGELKGLK